jgi:hypothetical protein
MHVPILAERNVAITIIHHIHISDDPNDEKSKNFDYNHKHIFAVLRNLESKNIDRLLFILQIYQNESPKSVGIILKLIIASLLQLYGFPVAKNIIENFTSLIAADKELITADAELQNTSFPDRVKKCRKLNERLVNLNNTLTGIRL